MFRQFKIELKPAPVGSSAHKKCGSRATFLPDLRLHGLLRDYAAKDVAGADKENRMRQGVCTSLCAWPHVDRTSPGQVQSCRIQFGQSR
jgi:hypothetical protein